MTADHIIRTMKSFRTRASSVLTMSKVTAMMLAILICWLPAFSEDSKDKVIPADQVLIAPQMPKPMFVDGRRDLQAAAELLPNFEKPLKRVDSFLAPNGTINLAKGLVPTSSCPEPNQGAFEQITDEDADASDDCIVVLSPGPVWIQFDLKYSCDLEKIWVWHCHKNVYVPMDVVVQISDDPFFEKGVTTLFNNDFDDTLKFGKGKDPTYVNLNWGKLIDAKGKKARHVRLWSNGGFHQDEDNRYTEVMIFGRPGKPEK